MIFHKVVEQKYRSQMFVRCDETGLVHYFSHKDFDGLSAEPYAFTSSLGHAMQGYFYRYDGADPDRLIIFEHGFGGGHRSYMKEIEKLCAKGFSVFAYDHTGCMESGGEGARGFSQSLRDLDDCLKALKADATVNTADISVIGHSWGGFSAMNIPALHPDVKRIVALCGFVSVEKIIEQNFSGILRGYRKHILQLEANSNPDYVGYDAATTLKNAAAKALLIYSDNDPIVHRNVHCDALVAALDDRTHMDVMLVSGKGHNPNYTADAVALLGELAARTKREAKVLQTAEARAAFKSSFDWDRMTEQDDAVWERIFAFLK